MIWRNLQKKKSKKSSKVAIVELKEQPKKEIYKVTPVEKVEKIKEPAKIIKKADTPESVKAAVEVYGPLGDVRQLAKYPHADLCLGQVRMGRHFLPYLGQGLDRPRIQERTAADL